MAVVKMKAEALDGLSPTKVWRSLKHGGNAAREYAKHGLRVAYDVVTRHRIQGQ